MRACLLLQGIQPTELYSTNADVDSLNSRQYAQLQGEQVCVVVVGGAQVCRCSDSVGGH